LIDKRITLFIQTSEELELARVVQSAIQSAILLEKFPKLVLDIRCTVLEKDGSVASAIINGTTMALVDAGIEMKDMVSACSMAMYGGNTMVIDPSGDEEKKGYATITMSIAPVSGMVTYMSCSGPWEESDFQKALKMGIVGCATYDGTMRTFLQNHALSLT
jgi:ribonuclease PH